MNISPTSVEVIDHRDLDKKNKPILTCTIKVELLVDKTRRLYAFLIDRPVLVFQNGDDGEGLLEDSEYDQLARDFENQMCKDYPDMEYEERMQILHSIFDAINTTQRPHSYEYRGPKGQYAQLRTKGYSA